MKTPDMIIHFRQPHNIASLYYNNMRVAWVVVLLTVGRSYVGNDVTHSTAGACSYENLPKYRSYRVRVSNTAPRLVKLVLHRESRFSMRTFTTNRYIFYKLFFSLFFQLFFFTLCKTKFKNVFDRYIIINRMCCTFES